MKRLFCLVGITLALGTVMPLHGEDLPGKIDVVIVSASSSSLESDRSSSSVAQDASSSASVVPSSSSRRSEDDSPLIPVISHDSKSEGTSALPRGVAAPAAQGMDRWFDLQGRLLKGKPSVQGTYYHNGKAVVIR